MPMVSREDPGFTPVIFPPRPSPRGSPLAQFTVPVTRASVVGLRDLRRPLPAQSLQRGARSGWLGPKQPHLEQNEQPPHIKPSARTALRLAQRFSPGLGEWIQGELGEEPGQKPTSARLG